MNRFLRSWSSRPIAKTGVEKCGGHPRTGTPDEDLSLARNRLKETEK
jgi:hypothetical protein